MSIVGQFEHLLGVSDGETAGSERPSTLLPAGGSLQQLKKKYCLVFWVKFASYLPSSLLQMLPPHSPVEYKVLLIIDSEDFAVI